MPSLSEKLKSLGVQVGAQNISSQPRKRGRGVPIEEVVEGRFLETPFGKAFVVESKFPPGHKQGLFDLLPSCSFDRIAAWAGEPGILDLSYEEFIFLDTETSGLSVGAGTYAFLIGLGRFEAGGFHLAQYFMRDPIEELAQLIALTDFLGNRAGLVTFNGKAYDVPLLNTRFITHGERSPFKSPSHIDLLPLARRIWRDRLPSRALGYLEEHILGASRSHEDVPGWLIPGLYFDYLRSGDARPLKNVFYHNAMDILSMAALLNHLAQLLEDPLNGLDPHGIDLIAIGKLYEDLGDVNSAAECYVRGLGKPIPEEVRSEGLKRWSFLEKRRENWEKAIEIWTIAAQRSELYAFEELAKFYEHRLRDYPQAVHWTQSAIDTLQSLRLTRFEREHWLQQLTHRLERLRKKSE